MQIRYEKAQDCLKNVKKRLLNLKPAKWADHCNEQVHKLRCRPKSSAAKGVGMEGATEALAPAMLKPRGRVFSPPQYFPDFCMLYQS